MSFQHDTKNSSFYFNFRIKSRRRRWVAQKKIFLKEFLKNFIHETRKENLKSSVILHDFIFIMFKADVKSLVASRQWCINFQFITLEQPPVQHARWVCENVVWMLIPRDYSRKSLVRVESSHLKCMNQQQQQHDTKYNKPKIKKEGGKLLNGSIYENFHDINNYSKVVD